LASAVPKISLRPPLVGTVAAVTEATVGQVVVLGAGVGGLATALALGRAGRRVTVLERDATPLPEDPRAAFSWDRRGAPQVRHSHAFLARLRNLLRDRYPDVLADLLAAGATEIDFAAMLPPGIEDRSPREGDADLVALACRRTTFEWVLRRSALACEGVELLDGVVVEGLVGDAAAPGARPVVRGVRARHGDERRELTADLVVAANGRRSPLPTWLEPLGADLQEVEEDTGIVYLSRFYELAPGAVPPPQDGPIGGDLGYLKYAVFQGDNRTFSVTFAVLTDDRELRSRLLDPDTFDRAARHLPATAAWAEPGLATPLTGVEVMAKLLNRRRRFLVDDDPVVSGFTAVGDAHTCTNPLYGRGCSLAVVQADLLAEALAQHPTDLDDALRAYEASSRTQVEPWYQASVQADRQTRAWAERERRALRGEDTTDLDASEDVATRDLLRHGLMPAVSTDPDVFRAFLRMMNLLQSPEQLMTDPMVIGTVLQTYQERDERPPEEPLGPPRREMLEHLTSSAA
jgi:2-polyprenyl-6-methoxyphenol hydroxylase-like FAD-dependent oxidoreductase